MRYRMVDDAETVTYVIICDPGDEASEALLEVARRENLTAAQITAVGAFARATVGWLDPHSSQYKRIPVDEQCEVLSLVGDVAVDEDGAPAVHMHAVLGLSDASTRGGHLIEGHVYPTLEVIVRETPAQLRKIKRTGIAVPTIDLDASDT